MAGLLQGRSVNGARRRVEVELLDKRVLITVHVGQKPITVEVALSDLRKALGMRERKRIRSGTPHQ